MKYGTVKKLFGHARFAVDPGVTNPSPEGASASGGGGTDPKPAGENPPITFEDFLKEGKNQAEFDRRVNSAIDTAVSRARQKWEVLANDKISEAEKLAHMTSAEKTEYLAKKKEQELASREAEITKRELQATAKNTLADKKLPQELAEILVYTDAESCKKSIEQVEKAFNAAVEASVQDRLKGSAPDKKASSDAKKTMVEEVAAALNGRI